jgi:hypothetical protein
MLSRALKHSGTTAFDILNPADYSASNCGSRRKEEVTVPYDKEERIITEHDYQALKEAIDKVADASQGLDEGVKALKSVIKKCCIHKGGATERRAS